MLWFRSIPRWSRHFHNHPRSRVSFPLYPMQVTRLGDCSVMTLHLISSIALRTTGSSTWGGKPRNRASGRWRHVFVDKAGVTSFRSVSSLVMLGGRRKQPMAGFNHPNSRPWLITSHLHGTQTAHETSFINNDSASKWHSFWRVSFCRGSWIYTTTTRPFRGSSGSRSRTPPLV
jgi:hypothetical protein